MPLQKKKQKSYIISWCILILDVCLLGYYTRGGSKWTKKQQPSSTSNAAEKPCASLHFITNCAICDEMFMQAPDKARPWTASVHTLTQLHQIWDLQAKMKRNSCMLRSFHQQTNNIVYVQVVTWIELNLLHWIESQGDKINADLLHKVGIHLGMNSEARLLI